MNVMKPVALLLLGALVNLIPTHARAEEKPPVKLGVLTDFSGIYSSSTGAGAVEAARMAIEDFGGTVLDRKIELVSADHQNKPDIGLGILSRWYDVDNVSAVFELVNSTIALGAFKMSQEKNRIAVTTGSGSSEITGKGCVPNGFQWVWDTESLGRSIGSAVTKQGGTSWFFVTVDYSFGRQLEADATGAIKAAGGTVVGSVKFPSGTPDFSSFLLTAQNSGAKVIGLAAGGQDLINLIRQAHEFGLDKSGTKLVGFITLIADVKAIGLETASGLTLLEAFYWDLNDDTRKWSQRFYERRKAMPSMIQAGVYSSVLHYLKAVKAAGTVDGSAVSQKMRELPVDDMFARNGKIRSDGLLIHDVHLFEAKPPAQSKGPWDLYNLVRTTPGNESYSAQPQEACASAAR
jgi:branched-chain amino acid transport system substrate-binding protein